MQKYDFSLKTRDGQKVESILIAGRDQPDAERKLHQMYRNCVVTRCEVRQSDDKYCQAVFIEDVLTLIAKYH
ncbi:MAG: hypothetical protein KGZ83_09220 [Sulfuricella sp.]|nr:hypothetical protein [Sulfuricella sp.]